MADDYSSVDHLRLRTSALCVSLSQRFEELLAGDFPDDGANKAINLVIALLRLINTTILAATDERTIVMIGLVLAELGCALEYFDNAETDQTPRGLVQLLEVVFKKLDRDSRILAWPQSSYNFTIRGLKSWLGDLTENLLDEPARSNELSAYDGPENLVSFPRSERDNVLMHAVFGHEMGHRIASKFIQAEKLKPEFAKELGQTTLALRNRLNFPKGSLTALQFRQLQEAMSIVISARRRALEEMISDAVGIYLFGPSALFAANDLFAWSELNALPSAANDFYPCPRMRLRLCLKVSRAENYLKLCEHADTDGSTTKPFDAAYALIVHLDKICGVDSDQTAINSDPNLATAYGWVESSLTSAITFAKNEVGSAQYLPQDMQSEIPDLVERLRRGVPPNERGDPLAPTVVDERSAILAAWLVRLQGESLGDAAQPAFAQKDLARIQELTLRAIEYMAVQRSYNLEVLKR